MRLTILGSGTVCPSLERRSSGYLIDHGEHRLCLDMGMGTLRAMLAHCQPWHIDALVFSHTHPDHVADLVPFLFALNYAPEWRTRERPLPIYGPPGFGEFLSRLEAAIPFVGANHYARTVHELSDGQEFAVGELRLRAYQVDHGEMPALAYRIEVEGRSFCFSGDTAVCPGIEAACRGVDLFLCECSIPRGYPQVGSHLSSDEVGQICERNGVGRVLLTHIYPLPPEIDLVAEVTTFFSGPAELAQDDSDHLL